MRLLSDLIFILLASQLGDVITPGPRTREIAKQLGPFIVFGFLMIKNGVYTTDAAATSVLISLVAYYGYRSLP